MTEPVSAATAASICNLAQIKLGASETVGSIDAPVNPAERRYSQLFPHYRLVELRARRWVFATVEAPLNPLGASNDPNFPWSFQLPNDCLRVLREDGSDWRQAPGRRLFSPQSALRINYIANVAVADFDPSFVEVLACRLALEVCEKVTQSTSKKEDLRAAYTDAVRMARQLNAFLLPTDNISDDDSKFSWLTERR
jgi:hypothetical protein